MAPTRPPSILTRLQWQLAWALLLLAFLPLGALGLYAYEQTKQSYVAQVGANVLAVARMVEARLMDAVADADRQLALLSAQPDAQLAPTIFGRVFTPDELPREIYRFFSGQRLQSQLTRQVDFNPLFSAVLCVRPGPPESGGAAEVMYASDELIEGRRILPDFWISSEHGRTINPRYQWEQALKTRDTAPRSAFAPITAPFGEPRQVLVMARQFSDADGNPAALIGVLELSKLQRLLESMWIGGERVHELARTGDTYVAVTGGRGEMLAGTLPQIGVAGQVLPPLIGQLQQHGSEFMTTTLSSIGEALVAVSSASAPGWHVLAAKSAAPAMREIHRVRNTTWGAIGFAVVLVGALGTALSSRLRRPVATLVEGLERYTDRALIEQLDQHPDRVLTAGQGAKRTATVLFMDIRGFTRLSEQMSADDVVKMLIGVFNRVSAPIVQFEGRIDKFIGDAMMAVFGLDTARPDDAFRAVRAALEIQRVIAEYNVQRRGWGLQPIEVGIGINTGTVVAGSIGCDLKLDWTVVGDPVNVASRLCAQAEPGQTLVSTSTYEHTGGALKVTFLGEHRVRGREGAVGVYEVYGVRTDEPG